MEPSFTQLLYAYQTYALEGDTLEKAVSRLISEHVPFIMACNILIRVYSIAFNDAAERVQTLNNLQRHYDSPELVARFIDDYQSLSEREQEIEPTVVRLRSRGLSVGDAVKILRILYGINLGQAKQSLLGHPVWYKEREFSEKMLEIFLSQDISGEDH